MRKAEEDDNWREKAADREKAGDREKWKMTTKAMQQYKNLTPL